MTFLPSLASPHSPSPLSYLFVAPLLPFVLSLLVAPTTTFPSSLLPTFLVVSLLFLCHFSFLSPLIVASHPPFPSLYDVQRPFLLPFLVLPISPTFPSFLLISSLPIPLFPLFLPFYVPSSPLSSSPRPSFPSSRSTPHLLPILPSLSSLFPWFTYLLFSPRSLLSPYPFYLFAPHSIFSAFLPLISVLVSPSLPCV